MSTVSYLLSVLIPGEDLQFVTVDPPGFTDEFNNAASWSVMEDAQGYKEALVPSFTAQGYRLAEKGEELGSPEDPLSKTVMITLLRSSLEPVASTALIKG